MSRVRSVARDGHTLAENRQTQPLVAHRAFNNPEVLTEGWYPVCLAARIKRGRAESFRIGYQRIVVYRGDDGVARSLDAFCPHMGADLANGDVVGAEIRCYFHRWRFDGAGRCTAVGAGGRPPKNAALRAYPVEERYGFVWVFAGEKAHHPLPTSPGLEGQKVLAHHLGTVRLFAHHHAMMAGGIDLQHFATVHRLDVDLSFEVLPREPGVADWQVRGELARRGVRARLGRLVIGPRFAYTLRVAGGSVAAITYGDEPRLYGRGPRLPTLHILWGCRPLECGVSEVEIFLLAERGDGARGRLAAAAKLAATLGLLGFLQDDDVKAFPHMRFNPQQLLPADRSVARLIQFLNGLPISVWSKA
jgi:nitrite reductase/ring-hydroxylating ferredoxin subunit